MRKCAKIGKFWPVFCKKITGAETTYIVSASSPPLPSPLLPITYSRISMLETIQFCICQLSIPLSSLFPPSSFTHQIQQNFYAWNYNASASSLPLLTPYSPHHPLPIKYSRISMLVTIMPLPALYPSLLPIPLSPFTHQIQQNVYAWNLPLREGWEVALYPTWMHNVEYHRFWHKGTVSWHFGPLFYLVKKLYLGPLWKFFIYICEIGVPSYLLTTWTSDRKGITSAWSLTMQTGQWQCGHYR